MFLFSCRLKSIPTIDNPTSWLYNSIKTRWVTLIEDCGMRLFFGKKRFSTETYNCIRKMLAGGINTIIQMSWWSRCQWYHIIPYKKHYSQNIYQFVTSTQSLLSFLETLQSTWRLRRALDILPRLAQSTEHNPNPSCLTKPQSLWVSGARLSLCRPLCRCDY